MNLVRNSNATCVLKWSGWTDRGKFRPNNEDSFAGLQFDAREVHHLGRIGESSMSHSDLAFAVSDGMGGANAGEYASKIAVEKIAQLLPRSFKQSAVGLEAGFADVLEELFDEVHHALAYLGSCYEECHGMEATLSICWFTPGWMYFGHIGDSRIYYLPANKHVLTQLSHDDTHVGWLLRNGKLTEHEARTHPRRTALQKALGGGNQFVNPQVGAVAYEPGDLFLLCTDGLHDGLYDQQMVESLRRSEDISPFAERGHELVNEALHHSGRDNITALVIQALRA